MSGSKFYRRPGGFSDNTDFVEVKANGDGVIHLKGGRTIKAGEGAFREHIESVAWLEIADPRAVVESPPDGQGDARSQFEAWYSSLPNPSPLTRGGDSDGYTWGPTHSAWLGWQAALAARQPVVPFGHVYRVVAGADHPSARRPWNTPGMVFEMGAARREGVHGNMQYLNLYTAPPAQAVDLGQFRDLIGFAALAAINLPETDPRRDFIRQANEFAKLIAGKAVQS